MEVAIGNRRLVIKKKTEIATSPLPLSARALRHQPAPTMADSAAATAEARRLLGQIDTDRDGTAMLTAWAAIPVFMLRVVK